MVILLVQYIGTRYHGFQLQANAVTIQGELEKALKRLTGEDIRVAAASRTDAGVHAKGQVVGFRAESEFATWMYRVALNTAITMTKKPGRKFHKKIKLDEIEDRTGSSDYDEEIMILYRAISKLKKLEKALILLWLEEKSYQEISDTIGISVKNVSVKLVRIKNKLEKIIKKMV